MALIGGILKKRRKKHITGSFFGGHNISLGGQSISWGSSKHSDYSFFVVVHGILGRNMTPPGLEAAAAAAAAAPIWARMGLLLPTAGAAAEAAGRNRAGTAAAAIEGAVINWG